jgi:hypothetical protein
MEFVIVLLWSDIDCMPIGQRFSKSFQCDQAHERQLHNGTYKDNVQGPDTSFRNPISGHVRARASHTSDVRFSDRRLSETS